MAEGKRRRGVISRSVVNHHIRGNGGAGTSFIRTGKKRRFGTPQWMADNMEISRVAEYAMLLNRPWRLIWLNLLAGTSRGVGIAIGFTFFAATIIYVLQVLGKLNLPIIGDYIADIVRIVQHQLELSTY
ncbi:DUF5665 domain-containing protein [Paenibacillus jiagnxiensis]|uniref:DUF5665 domain-containing protein n=1 Tax=Paenibacillus jiagnxiensis TaxID=3228926 RepID=UPI0033A8B6EF